MNCYNFNQLGQLKQALFLCHGSSWKQVKPHFFIYKNGENPRGSGEKEREKAKIPEMREKQPPGIPIEPVDTGGEKIPKFPDTMTGKGFMEALKLCKTPEEKQKLYVSWAASGKKAFPPEFLTPNYHETTMDGKTVKIDMRPLQFGRQGDAVPVSADPEVSRAIADMVGGELSTTHSHKILRPLINEKRKAAGLPPLKTNESAGMKTDNTHPDDIGTQIIAGFEIDGQKVNPKDFMQDPKYRTLREKLFGPEERKQSRKYPDWMKPYVKQGRKNLQPVMQGEDTVEKERVDEVPEVTPNDLATIRNLRTFGQEIAPDPENWQAQITEIRRNLPPGYIPPKGIPGAVVVIARNILGSGQPLGTMTPFQYDGKKYLAVKEWHGPDSGNPKEHPSISIFIAKEDAPPIPVEQLRPSTPEAKTMPYKGTEGAEVAEGQVPQMGKQEDFGRKSKLSHEAGPYKQAGYKSPQPGYAKTFSETGIAEQGSSYEQEAVPEPSSQLTEGLESPPTVPYTTLGDSFMVGMDANNRGQFVKFGYHEKFTTVPTKTGTRRKPEMEGQQLDYMLQQLTNEVIPSIKQQGLEIIVLGGGANNILVPLGSDEKMKEVYQHVTDNLREIYKTARDADLNVVAITMPPFGRFIDNMYSDSDERKRHYRLREMVNEFIINQAKDETNGPNKVVRADQFLQNPSNPKYLADDFGNRDELLHLNPRGYQLLAKETEKAVNEVSGQKNRSQ